MHTLVGAARTFLRGSSLIRKGRSAGQTSNFHAYRSISRAAQDVFTCAYGTLRKNAARSCVCVTARFVKSAILLQPVASLQLARGLMQYQFSQGKHIALICSTRHQFKHRSVVTAASAAAARP